MAEPDGSVLPGDTHYLGLTALVTVALQLSFFAIAFALRFDKVTDFAGGINFAVIALLTLGLGDVFTTRQVVLTSMVTVSRVELGVLLLVRVAQRGSDARFDETRDNFFRFLGFWIFQMVWVWTVSLPVLFVNGSGADPALDGRDYAGWALWLVGFVLEVVADLVKMSFRQNPANKGKFCDRGPWYFSRHPNYVGEIFMWWGLFISSVPVIEDSGANWGYISILSPLVTMVLLLFLSGIPTAEGSAQSRYIENDDTRDAYLAYREKTPPVLPWIPALYRRMPLWSKRVFCLELPMYEYRGAQLGSQERSDRERHNGAV